MPPFCNVHIYVHVAHSVPSLPGTYLRGYGIEKLPVCPQFSQLLNVPGYFTATVEKHYMSTALVHGCNIHAYVVTAKGNQIY